MNCHVVIEKVYKRIFNKPKNHNSCKTTSSVLGNVGISIFHDTKKGWTCCNKVVYDWDEFQKLPTCAVGRHTDKKVDDTFFKSNTVANATNALKKEEQKPVVIKDINQYNKGISLNYIDRFVIEEEKVGGGEEQARKETVQDEGTQAEVYQSRL